MNLSSLPFLAFLGRKREVVGIDLGASGAKFVVSRPDGPAAFFFPGVLLSHPEQEIAAGRDFLKAHGLQGASVACNIDDPSMKIRRIDLPKMPDYDLREAVRWQLRDVAEGSLDTYVVRYSILEEYLAGETKRLSLVAYAIKREAVARRIELLKKLSLNPVLIEPNAVSLLAAFDRVHGWEAGKAYALIDLGESRSLFTVMGEGKLFFSRPLGLAMGTAGAEPSAFYSALGVEVQRSLDAYSLMFHREKVDHLYVTGGRAGLPEMTDYLTKNLGVPSGVFDPFTGKEGKEGARYAVALGLALYGK